MLFLCGVFHLLNPRAFFFFSLDRPSPTLFLLSQRPLFVFKFYKYLALTDYATGAPTFLNFNLLMFRERGKGRESERHQLVVPLIYAFIGCFLYVPWPGIEPATLAYQDDALTDWATQPGPGLQTSLLLYSTTLPATTYSVPGGSFSRRTGLTKDSLSLAAPSHYRHTNP